MGALDANDAEGVRSWMAPGATWWVDTGLDRRAGRFGEDPGDERPWPLHGEMDAAEKSDLLAGVRERFPGGVRQAVRRAFAGDDIAVLEVAGDGMFLGERPYRNRYCFVVRVGDGRVTQVREYLDTRHAASVFEGRNLDRRTELDAQQFPTSPIIPTAHRREDPNRSDPDGFAAVRVLSATRAAAGVGVRLMAAISAADEGAFRALFTPDATWWADGGASRRWSDPEGPVDRDPELLVVGKVLVSQRAARIPGLRESYRDGLRIDAHRIVVDDDVAASGLVLVEAVSDGRRVANGRRYQNRYAFVLRLNAAGLVSEVREYCDTQHAFDVYELPL
ncbi:ketosteroid isomerase-like protein [Microbacterium sp. SLBN-146]|nr:ketosteroid isomerase-like protein [Microbacterium sp. SLBN-146]